jgi:hypothetical protein
MTLWDRGEAAEPSRSESTKTANRRSKDRKRQRLVDGFISSRRVPTPQPCTVCDMSAGGSKVELWNDAARYFLPGDRIVLYVPVDRREVDAEVRWRKGNALGMQFKSAFRGPTRAYVSPGPNRR